jgi:chemotaxis protein methyltransferase CheR
MSNAALAPAALPEIEEKDFTLLSRMLEDKTGISLSAAKRDLLQARLRSHIMGLGLGGFAEYGRLLRGLPPGEPEWQAFVNLLTTNKTEFFREGDHFTYLARTYLPQWSKGKDKMLRVWCCAASTGEEPYTLSICLGKNMPPNARTEILATDIDTDVLETARRGLYRSQAVTQIPPELRSGSIAVGSGDIKGWMRVNQPVKDRVTLTQHNLMDSDVPRKDFDLIFCRNVLIYFTPETIAKVATKLYTAARPGALLFIGHSESLQNVKHPWTYVSPSIYQKKGGA